MHNGMIRLGSDSGEGRRTIQAAIVEAVSVPVPVPVPRAALYAHFGLRSEADFANRVQSAIRHERRKACSRSSLKALT